MPKPIQLTCLCGSINEPASLLQSQNFPVENAFCHCNRCRRTTGALGTAYVQLKGPASAKSLANATIYHTAKFEQYFCKECGCNVFVRSKTDDSWIACSGTVEIARESGEEVNVSRVTLHEHVGAANDGGIAPYLSHLGGRDVPCYLGEPEGEPMAESELRQLRERALNVPSSVDRGEALEVACHCEQVRLQIKPPQYDEKSEGWYVPPDRSKYSARLCCCRSCRLANGFTMQPWSYIPPSRIYTATGERVIFGPEAKETSQIKELKYYQSSDSVLRSFCTTCGATVFYQSFERPYIIDVSVGVLRSNMGNALVGEWLDWDRDYVSKRDEAVDEELIRAWRKG
ncbi:hypothetical protein LTR41_007388 [Exophiala xenobiotica]|nr:hypothetical protein LTR41_007388 [Exophiala xenobiotica]